MSYLYLKLNSNYYKQLYGSNITSLSLFEFVKLPIGTVLYDTSTNLLVKLHSFSSSPLVGSVTSNKFSIDGYHNNFNIIGPNNPASHTIATPIPNEFFVTPYNTSSTFKLIKKGTPIPFLSSSYMNFLPVTEKLITCLFPYYYQSIQSFVKANVQYQNLVIQDSNFDNHIRETE